MDELAGAFEAERGRLRGLAFRMLGSVAEADDAVQEAWLRLNRVDSVDNLAAWLTTVVSRVCLDVLRRADAAALPIGAALEVRGARAVAEETQVFGKRARFAEAALVDGAVGVVVAPRGRLRLALAVTVEGERVAAYDVIADPARL